MHQPGEVPNFCQSFPTEIIEQVLTQLNVKELKESMEVCCRFESVIVNSPVLMKKFVVRCDINPTQNKDQMEVMLASKRKYRRIHFWHDKGAYGRQGALPLGKANLKAILQFVENQAGSLRNIVFWPEAIELFQILPAVLDLESLDIGWFKSYDGGRFTEVNMKELKRLTVYSRGNEPISWLMTQPMKLECFHFEDHYSQGEAASLIPFLHSQEQLKEIAISIAGLPGLLDNREVASSMKFRAKVISLKRYPRNVLLPTVHLPNLTSFLGTQKDSLQELELSNISLYNNDVDELLGLTLSKLILSKCAFIAPEDSKVTNKSIQSVAIAGSTVISGINEVARRQLFNDTVRAVNKIVQSCQALDTLELSNISLYNNDVDELLGLTLSELKLSECTFIAPEDSNVTNESIQNLVIAGSSLPEQWSVTAVTKIVQSCQALDTLELSDMFLKVSLSKTIASKQTLRTLKISKCDLNTARKFPSVKVLKVKGCTKFVSSRLRKCNRQLESFENIEGGDESEHEDPWSYDMMHPGCVIQ